MSRPGRGYATPREHGEGAEEAEGEEDEGRDSHEELVQTRSTVLQYQQYRVRVPAEQHASTSKGRAQYSVSVPLRASHGTEREHQAVAQL
eukprot:3185737-Rhodomonas_salina.3